MKFDKETIIVIGVCLLLIIGWNAVSPMISGKNKPAAEAQSVQTAPQTVQSVVPAASAQVPAVPVQTPASANTDASAVSAAKVSGPESAVLSNTKVDIVVSRTGSITSFKLKDMQTSEKEKDGIVFEETSVGAPMRTDIPGALLESASLSQNGNASVSTVENYRMPDGTPFSVAKDFSLPAGSGILKCTMTVASPKGSILLPSLAVWSGSLPPLKNFANDNVYRDVHQSEYSVGGSVKTVDAPSEPEKNEKYLKKTSSGTLDWVAVSNKYFLSMLYPSKPFDGGSALAVNWRKGQDGKDYSLPMIAGQYKNLTLPANIEFTFYAGAKDSAHMNGLPDRAYDAVHLSYWSWFEWLCRPMLILLNWLKAACGSYGLSIILLTVIVKLVLWPLINKGNKSMRKLQKVQPLVKELKEKYKHDQQTFNMKMMELYKKEGVSPFGGCFPMLLQLPIFIALYSTLDSAVELRHVPFLWAADLTKPDLVGPAFFMGYGIHPLILLSTALMVLQQKIMPQTSTDPMQQKMMLMMPVVMLIFFYNFPSGLALYWCVNNILSILQMKYTQYSAAKEEAAAAGKASAQ